MSEKRQALIGHALAYGDESNRRVSFRASTAVLDRHGSIIRPEGIETENFDKNPVFLWAHDGYDSWAGPPSMDSVIGRVPSHRKSEDAFDIDVDFAESGVNPYGEKALRMVRAKFLNAVSIGFYERDGGYEKIDGNEIYVYRRSELLEVSLVPIPANPEALVISNAFDKYLGLTPPPLRSGADVGEQLRRYAAGLRAVGTVRAFARLIAKG